MKKIYLLTFLMQMLTTLCFGQDCVTQLAVSDDTICIGGTAQIVLSNSYSGHNYQLRIGGTNIGPPIPGNNGDLTFNVSPTSTTNYSIYVVECDITYTDLGIVTVNPIPDVNLSISNQNVCSNQNITSIICTGSVGGTTFNWTRNNTTNVTGISDSGSGDISGALINNTTTTQAVTFTVTPTANGCTGTSVTSTVLVYPNAVATALTPNQTMCSGATLPSFGISSNVTGTTYTWTRDNTSLVTGIADNGTGTITGSLNNTTTSPQTVNFTVTPVANGCNGTPVMVSVLVNPIPDVNASITSQTICSGDSITSILFTSNVSGVTFDWMRSNPTLVTGLNTTGSGDISGPLYNNSTIARTTTFTITPKIGNCSGSSITVSITVNPAVTITAANSNIEICSGTTISLTNSAYFGITSTAGSTNYTWTRDNTTNVSSTIETGTGLNLGTLTNNTFVPQTVTYTVSPEANSCSGNAITVSVIVKPKPNVYVNLSTQTICNNTAISEIIPSGDVSGTTYTWAITNNPGNVTGISDNGTGSVTGTLTNNTSTNQTVRFTFTPMANGCSGTTVNANVTVRPTPAITAANPSITICSGTNINMLSAYFDITSTVLGTTYSWTRDNNTNVTGADSGTSTTLGTLTNTTYVPQTVNYTISSIYGGCPGNTITVSVIVNPRPNVITTPSSQSICSGDNLTPIILSSDVTGTTYTWTRSLNANVIGLESGGSGNITGSLVNTSTSNQTATFTITPTSPDGCNGTNITTVVTIFPTPYANASINTQTICSGNAITNISFTGISGTTFQWTRDNTANVLGTNSGSGTITGILTNTTFVQQTVTYTITPVRNGCSGTPITSTVIVEPTSKGGAVTVSLPNVTPTVNTTTQCHIANGTLYLSGHIGNVVRWEYSTNAGITWNPIANTTTSYNYSNITQTTVYRAVIKNEPNCTLGYSTSSMVNVIPNLKPSPVIATPATICAGQSSILSSSSSYATSSLLATGGSFSSSNPPGWSVGGCGNCLNAGSSNTNPNPWQLSATNGGTYSGINYTSGGKFAIANGEGITSYLYTPTFNTYGLADATLTFTHAYNFLTGAKGEVQISVNGGAYSTIATYTGALGPYNGFANGSIDLSPYLGQPNLRIRFYYYGNDTVVGNTFGSSWAIDNIQIPDAPVNLSTQWVDAITGTVVSSDMTMTVTPSTTTTYAVTSYLNGCNSFGTEGTAYVTVTVNQRPTAVIGTDQYVCFGDSAKLTVNFTGSAPWSITYSNGTTNTTINNINANPYTITIPNNTTTRTFTITALSDSKCTATPADITGSATITVLNGTQGVWTGLVSNDWFDCKNWEKGLPTATVDAYIPASSTQMPVINPATSIYAASYSNIAIARDLIIENGASVTMTSNSDLHIKRDWKNSGAFYPGNGNVTFNGATNNQVHLINDGIKLNENFYNLIINTSNGNKGVSVADGFELTVANNLILTSGDLRLVGEAQLVQNGTTANPNTGTGVLLRDQQGTKSSYHYNYWSSPVSSNNLNYTISEVLRDGTNALSNPFAPGSITFGDGYNFADGPLTSPIKISNRWLFKYTQVSTSYWSWQLIGNSGSIKVGEGYTMKGVTGNATITDYQNYVFRGKPNNGDINLTIAPNQLYLIGNPYPSAMDANAFIKDNIKDGGFATSNVFNGALYFWDHFGAQTHYLAQYIGGYATYSLMGGVVAISNDPLINANGSSGTKVPQRYIPVAQGFFVRTDLDPGIASSTNNPNLTSPISGGTIRFKNSQRAFKTESSGTSVFFKTGSNSVVESDNRPKIRIQYTSPNNVKRQILVGADANASSNFDLGFDAPMIDPNPNDAFWPLDNFKFTIQALNQITETTIIPIGIKVTNTGNHKLKVFETENIAESTSIYIHDNVTGLYHDIKNGEFTISLTPGEYSNRFTVRFLASTLGTENPDLSSGLLIFNDNEETLNIVNNLNNVTINSVTIFNLLGQTIEKWDTKNEFQDHIRLNVNHLSSATYIVKLNTSDGILTQKIFIK